MWALHLNSIAGWVLKNEGLERWADLARAWRDVRTLFGPASALRLLDLPELVELVDVETPCPVDGAVTVMAPEQP